MNITKQYIAGFVDGEGYIGLTKRNDSRAKRGFYLRFRVELTNQHKPLLESIQRHYGGRMSQKTNKNPCWQLSLENKEECKILLKEIIPYLIIKKDKAKVLFDYLDRENRILTDNQIDKVGGFQK